MLGGIRGLSRLSCQHPFQGADEELRPFQGVDVDAASLQQREGPSPPDGKLNSTFAALEGVTFRATTSCPTRKVRVRSSLL